MERSGRGRETGSAVSSGEAAVKGTNSQERWQASCTPRPLFPARAGLPRTRAAPAPSPLRAGCQLGLFPRPPSEEAATAR
ncbi:hypothetical protein SKAU_G00104770 [Synaphobranchus kaupii]|uniref:Uncharacterized protein n=1 Tax=Synaphobranchus kaupii TaxID=118154 RepID=A0A9Q1FYY2_SYNKA|nr:hypothetical protein SKAU_G00104770 [Synaphobranchus kaupii]